jgi:hypothetical protein
VLRRDARRRQRRSKEKAEAVIVPMITDEDAALGSSVTDLSKTFTDERAAHTAPLKRELDRHRTECEPPGLCRRTRLRERGVTDDLLVQHGDQGQSERVRFA